MNGRMPIALAMADEPRPDAEPPKIGSKNVEPDAELIKLARTKVKFGVITAAGVLFLAIFFLIKLDPDRRFAGNDDSPRSVAVADFTSGKVDKDAFVALQAEPLMSHAVRAGTAKNSMGLRIVPVKGASEKVWIVLPGDGWEKPTKAAYQGRARLLSDLPFSGVLADFLAKHPRPLFATAAAIRAGFASGKVKTVGGDEITVGDNVKIGFDVVDPNAALVVGTYNERHKDLAAWQKALTDAGLTVKDGRDDRERGFFEVAMPNAVETAKTKLDAAGLVAGRVDPVTHHYDTTWGALKASGPAGFTATGTTVPDAQVDLVGLYVVRSIPSDAWAVIVGEQPQDYWYVLPVAILVALIGLLFAWALVRAVKRDFLTRPSGATPAL